MDCEPWRYACGPGGHYYDKCCPSISSSCFKNSKTPTRRVVYEYVVECPDPTRYPTFCDHGCYEQNDHGGCGGGCGGHGHGGHGCGGGHGCTCDGHGHHGGHGHRDHNGGHGHRDHLGHYDHHGRHTDAARRVGRWEEHDQPYERCFDVGVAGSRGHDGGHYGRGPATPPVDDTPYEEWRKTALSNYSQALLA